MQQQHDVLMFQIIPESPLLIGNRSGTSNFQETGDFLPGSVLRGAVATKLLNACMFQNNITTHLHCPDPANCPYLKIFGGEEPFFGNAYPGASYGPVWPMPLTARTCKRHGGWDAVQQKPKHGIFDILLADFAYGLVSDPEYPQRAIIQPQLKDAWSTGWQPDLRQTKDVCPICGEPVKPAVQQAQFYAWHNQLGAQPANSIAKKRAVHVGINRARGVAEDALLFTQESLAPQGTDQSFFAEVIVPHGKTDALKQALSGTFYVGRGRSRGYGQVLISAKEANSYPALTERLEEFQSDAALALKPYAQKEKRLQLSWPGSLFSLTLRSAAILEQYERPLRVPDPLHHLGLPEDVVLLQSWARTEQVGGWNSAAGMPRRTQLATQAGAVFLYYAPENIATSQLESKLNQLEHEGIGLERERGYGRVTVCARFHAFQPDFG